MEKNSKIYKYNDYEEVKKWDVRIWQRRLRDINPEIICKIAEEELYKHKKIDPKYFEQKLKYEKIL